MRCYGALSTALVEPWPVAAVVDNFPAVDLLFAVPGRLHDQHAGPLDASHDRRWTRNPGGS